MNDYYKRNDNYPARGKKKLRCVICPNVSEGKSGVAVHGLTGGKNQIKLCREHA